MEKTKSPNWGSLLRWGGSILSSALFIWLIARQNWSVVLEKAAGIPFWAILLATVFCLLSFWFNTLRWCLLLWAQGVKISLWQAYRLTWAGNFASNFLPSTIGGDGFRILAVHPYTGSKSISIGSVALDRIINMSAWVCLLPTPLIIFGASFGALLKQLFGPLPGALVLPGPLQKLFEKYFPKVVSAVQMWSAKPWAFVHAFLAAWPSNLLPIAATWLIAQQLGIHVNYWQVIGVQTVAYFLSVLPISVNGYGLREAVFTTLYASLGASLEQASTLALVTRFVMMLCTIPGAIWLTSVVKTVDGGQQTVDGQDQ
jgi:uncharacterized membrane protein YbhN (UPF0104 family)